MQFKPTWMQKDLDKLQQFKNKKTNDYHYPSLKVEKRSGYVRSIYEGDTYRHNLNTKE